MIFDFRLKVFYVVAQKLSFTKAAHELFITQPAVTKHIKELEEQFGTPLFTRHGANISITAAGQILVRHAKQIFLQYAALESELSQLSQSPRGTIRLGASTTLAQYVLPRILALFKQAHPAVQFTFISGNSEYIEQQVIDGHVDLALVEGVSNQPQIMYEPFVKDEIVLVSKTSGSWVKKGDIKVKQLTTIPLVMREQGSGTLAVIHKALRKNKIKIKELTVDLQLGSTESIKEYLLYSDSAAFLSIHAIANEVQQNKLGIITVMGLDIYRTFQFIQPYGQRSKLPSLFQRFCLNHYNFKL